MIMYHILSTYQAIRFLQKKNETVDVEILKYPCK